MVSKQWSDVAFLVQESEIHAHWLIIAMRSLLLYETLVASTTDSVVRIGDMKAVVLRAVLHFVYTDELVPVNETVVAREMLAVACWFRLERMKAMCKNLLAHLIEPADVLSGLGEGSEVPESTAKLDGADEEEGGAGLDAVASGR